MAKRIIKDPEGLAITQQRLHETTPSDIIDRVVQVVIKPSEYQQAVMTWVEVGTGSAVVIAVAGSGKTKTIELSLPGIPESKYVTILAFNKTIADELNARLDKLRKPVEDGGTGRPFRNFRASTFHSLGGAMVAKHLGCRSVRDLQTDSNKVRKIAEHEAPSPEFYAMYGDFSVKLVGFAKGEGIGAITNDTDEAWWALVRHHDLTLESEEAMEQEGIDFARYLLGCSNNSAKGRYIDFDDMLYLPLLWKLRPFQSDFVMVDEAQDTNPVRRALVKSAMRPGGRSLWVGDSKQAIYGFTGASNNAIDLIKHQFNAVEMPLTICYRCASSVVELAQTIVPYIEAAPNAPQGLVEHDVDHKDAMAKLTQHDAVLCRQTAPLIDCAYKLIGEGRGCVVLGREIGQGLINLIKRLRVKTIVELETKVEAYREREVTKFMSRGEEQKAERINDHCDCIVTLINHLPEDSRTIAAMIKRIEGLFSDSNGVLTLSTVHKAKGREWERVYILRPDTMPSKWARQDWQVEQEENLRYVAYTRAMTHLMIGVYGPTTTKEA